MLWKAWQESRTRFMITALVLTALCFFATLSGRQIGSFASDAPSARVYNLIYGGTAKGVFALLSIFLGLGGLMRERAHQTATFTLALPVSRLQFAGSQIGVGSLQVAALSLLPALLVPPLSVFAHQPYPFSAALHFSLLWFVCGMLIFALAYFLSVVLEGEYTAPVACYILLMLQALIASWTPLRPYRLNLLWTMAEFPAMPWERLLILILIALSVFALAAWRMQKQDF